MDGERQGILFGHFYATGYRVWRDLPHILITSLVKYLSGIDSRVHHSLMLGEKMLTTTKSFAYASFQIIPYHLFLR